MVKIADIEDHDSLKAWLKAQPKDLIRPYAMAIASRAALRGFPDMWKIIRDNRTNGHFVSNMIGGVNSTNRTSPSLMNFIRCQFISSVSAAKQSQSILSSIQSAYIVANQEFGNPLASSRSDAVLWVLIAANTVFAPIESVAMVAASITANSMLDLEIESQIPKIFWPEIQADCSLLTADNTPKNWPLWQGNSDPFADIWADVKQDIPAEMTFWADWYEAMLVGQPQNWDMLEEIALLPNKDWKAGAERIAELIAEVEARNEVQDLPAETTPQNALMKNASAIEAQLNALEIFVQDEIERICKNLPNDISDEARKQIDRRIDVLKGIIDAIREMIKSLADESIQTGTALATFDKNLPAVIDAADSIAQQQPEVSETIVAMGATVSHLTNSGMPGTIASGVAAAELVFKPIKKWLYRKK